MNLLRALATISGMTLISRILGFVRDAVIARLFGAGLYTDAFFVAFRIPNLLRRLFAEGAFAQAFVPILAEYKTREGEAHGGEEDVGEKCHWNRREEAHRRVGGTRGQDIEHGQRRGERELHANDEALTRQVLRADKLGDPRRKARECRRCAKRRHAPPPVP